MTTGECSAPRLSRAPRSGRARGRAPEIRRRRRYNPRVPKRSPYEGLGVDIEATGATIKAAWRRLAREHHPDTTGGDAQAARAATRRMAEINAAYEELRDPVKRRAAADRERA